MYIARGQKKIHPSIWIPQEFALQALYSVAHHQSTIQSVQ
jgi:hypothetical protein